MVTESVSRSEPQRESYVWTRSNASNAALHVAPTHTETERAPNQAEVVAKRKRVWERAREIARVRRARLAAVRSGAIARDSLSASELKLLESVDRIERASLLKKWAARLGHTGLWSLIGGFIAWSAAFRGACGNAVLKYPLLLKLAVAAGAVGLVALLAALIAWLARYG